MKELAKLFTASLLLLTLYACQQTPSLEDDQNIIVPNLHNTRDVIAEQITAQKSLIPITNYIYHDTVIKDHVISTNPRAGQTVQPYS